MALIPFCLTIARALLPRSFKEESKQRMAVLRKLGHIDSNGIVQLKVRGVFLLLFRYCCSGIVVQES